MDKCGSYYTMDRATAERALPRLRDAIDEESGKLVVVTIVKATMISGDHDWVVFLVPAKHHAAARMYLNGWKEGGCDALDFHYGRPSYAAWLDNAARLSRRAGGSV